MKIGVPKEIKTNENRIALVPAGAEARVAHVVMAACAVAREAALVPALVRSTGLSPEGVALALRAHLELAPSASEVARLIARAMPAPHVHVVLSANVFVGALRAIACAVAAAPKVTVQTSSREPTFADALLTAITSPAISKVDREIVSRMTIGEIHVYGRSETIAAVRASALPGVVVRAHGPGFGIACIAGSDDLAIAATALASDVVVFDQRGCLSPRVAFVVGDAARASAFAKALASALETWATHVPRGALASDEVAEAARYVETMRFAGEAFVGPSSVVGMSDTFVLPPTGRHVHVVAVARGADVATALGDALPFVTTAGTNDGEIAASFPSAVRIAALGEMQKPPFDGPVDLRSF